MMSSGSPGFRPMVDLVFWPGGQRKVPLVYINEPISRLFRCLAEVMDKAGTR